MPTADLVLEGGGVKGLGLVGAVLELMEQGWSFARVAGTSAGSIVAAFVAAGLDRDGFEQVLNRLDYARVPDRRAPCVPLLSESLSLLWGRGAYVGDYVHDFLRTELARLGIVTFADLRHPDPQADASLDRFRRYRLVVTATDVTNGRLLRLPWDYELLGLDPDEQLVADAIRASIAIPLFFTPVVWHDRRRGLDVTVVDGGVLSSFPIEIFDRTDGLTPRWPTFGIKVMPHLPQERAELLGPLAMLPTPPVTELAQQVLMTAIVGHDQTYLERPCVARRTIRVDTDTVGIVDFGASAVRRTAAVEQGRSAAAAFLAGWDWQDYLASCRGVGDGS